MARYTPYTAEAPYFDYGDYGAGGRPGPALPGEDEGDLPPVPTGFVRIQTGWKTEYDDRGNVRRVPVYTTQLDPTYRRPSEGGSGRTVFPWEREGQELQNERLRQQIGAFDPALERDRFGASEQQRAIDNAYREARFEYEKAINARDFAAAEKWRERADYWTEVREGRADRSLKLEAELGYADSERKDARLLMDEAVLYGADRQGRQTAQAKQQAFENTYLVGRDARATAERAQARDDLLTEQTAARAERGRARAFDETQLLEDRAERKRQFDVSTAIAGRQPAPRTVQVSAAAYRPY